MFTIIEAKNPVRTASGFTVDVLFKELGEFIPYHATPEDTAEHGKILYDNINKGSYGEILPFVENIEDVRYFWYEYVRGVYAESLREPVTCFMGTFNGGEGSAMAIQNAIALADLNGESTLIITDINNQEVLCTREQANAISAAIGNKCRELFLKKQSFMRDIATAETIEAVKSVVWA